MFKFETDELLRGAFLTLSGEGLENTRTYSFALESAENGVYVYRCNFYADSKYLEASSLDANILVIDKAGNTGNAQANFEIIKPKSVSGKLTFEGAGVSGARVVLCSPDGMPAAYEYTDDNGEYLFNNIIPGNYYITHDPKGYKSARVDIAKSEFSDNIVGKDLALETIQSGNSEVTISVLNGDGTPAGDVYVSLYSWDMDINVSKNTSADGKAVFSNIPYSSDGTEYRVYVSNNSFYDTKSILVEDTTTYSEFQLPQIGKIRGSVTLRGEKLADTEVNILGNRNNVNVVT